MRIILDGLFATLTGWFMILSWNMKTVIVGVGTKNCKWKKVLRNSSAFDGYNEIETIELLTNTFKHVKNDVVIDTLFLPFCNLYNWPKKNVRSSFRKLVWHLTWKAKKVCLFINTKNIFTSWTVCCWNKIIHKILSKSLHNSVNVIDL